MKSMMLKMDEKEKRKKRTTLIGATEIAGWRGKKQRFPEEPL
ncbi:hypothetical protein [Klebsiella variicola]|jgi:hypothetical protein|nr:hypothetical protein [Klebsiella variicola]